MIDWYYLFTLVIAVLSLGAVPRDRTALAIVLVATLASWVLVDAVTCHMEGAWKLCVPATVETLTIMSLLKWADKPYGQCGCLVVAWACHLLCFADIKLGTDIVYTNYETLLAWIAAAQIALFYETYLHHIRRLGHWWSKCGGDRDVAVHGPSLSSPVFLSASNPRSQPIPPPCTTT